VTAEFDTQWKESKKRLGKLLWMAANPTPDAVTRMMARHRAQLEEVLTNYGDMLSLDRWLGPTVWPQLRETVFRIRQLQPNVMIRARGIGNYGDCSCSSEVRGFPPPCPPTSRKSTYHSPATGGVLPSLSAGGFGGFRSYHDRIAFALKDASCPRKG
jgi:hypothetical protein